MTESEKYSSDIRTEIQFVKARELKVKGMQGRKGVKQMQGARCKQLIQKPDAKSLSPAAKLILYILYKVLAKCTHLSAAQYAEIQTIVVRMNRGASEGAQSLFYLVLQEND